MILLQCIFFFFGGENYFRKNFTVSFMMDFKIRIINGVCIKINVPFSSYRMS